MWLYLIYVIGKQINEIENPTEAKKNAHSIQDMHADMQINSLFDLLIPRLGTFHDTVPSQKEHFINPQICSVLTFFSLRDALPHMRHLQECIYSTQKETIRLSY